MERDAIETSLSQRNAFVNMKCTGRTFDRWSISSCPLLAVAVHDIQPSHLWDDDWSNTRISKPARVVAFELSQRLVLQR